MSPSRRLPTVQARLARLEEGMLDLIVLCSNNGKEWVRIHRKLVRA